MVADHGEHERSETERDLADEIRLAEASLTDGSGSGSPLVTEESTNTLNYESELKSLAEAEHAIDLADEADH